MAANGATFGARVGVALGQRKSEQQTLQAGTSAVGSTVMAGQDVTIRATGAGANSNLNVIGSEVTAGRDAALHADGAINLLAATSTAEQRSRNSSSGASVGVSFGFGAQNGFAIELAANQARGNADGEDLTNVNTNVTAGRTLSPGSGGDTTLRGAVAAGDRVQTNIGGNLLVESLQDTSVFDARQSSSGFNMSLCIPPICYGTFVTGSASVSRASVNGDFASVTEQSALRAGDGGFNVNVHGSTSLVGGAITSTPVAVDAGRNSLSTATLTARDIVNRDAYEADGLALSGSFSAGQTQRPGSAGSSSTNPNAGTPSRGGGANISGVGLYTSEGQQNSVTRSGVSGATVTITNDAAQRALTGQGGEATVAALNRAVTTGADTTSAITRAWDGNQLIGTAATGASLTQQFGANASRAVGDYAARQQQPVNEAREADALRGQGSLSSAEQQRLDQLEQRGYTVEGSRTTLNDPALLQQHADWEEGSTYRVAAHAVVGGLTGGASGLGALQGMLGAGTSAATVPRIASEINALDLPEPVRVAAITLVGTGLGAVAGGAPGAMTAVNHTTNNFLRHEEANAMRRDMAQCRAKPSGCSDAETMTIVARYREVSGQNIAAVDQCVATGNVACVQGLLGQAASASEVSGILPFGYGMEERQFIERQNNVVQYGSVRGSYSMFGSDVQQAQDIAQFRQANCGGLSSSACDTLTRQALDDRLVRVGVLTAVGGVTAGAVNAARSLRVPGRAAGRAEPEAPPRATTTDESSTPNFGRQVESYGQTTYRDADGNVIPSGNAVPRVGQAEPEAISTRPTQPTTASPAVGETTFRTSHYAARLEAEGVSVARAESAVAWQVEAMRGSMATSADIVGRLVVDGVHLEFRVRLLPNGTVNVGTIFPIKP